MYKFNREGRVAVVQHGQCHYCRNTALLPTSLLSSQKAPSDLHNVFLIKFMPKQLLIKQIVYLKMFVSYPLTGSNKLALLSESF